jgi:hypothetical protein
MKGRLLDICVLAYPRARRERDRAYLRDLALDLSETHGLWRQAASLVRGGLGERAELRRRTGAVLSRRAKRLVVACSALAVVALAASSLIWPSAGEGGRVESERLTCANPAHRVCADALAMVAARQRDGWDCATRRDVKKGERVLTLRCSL